MVQVYYSVFFLLYLPIMSSSETNLQPKQWVQMYSDALYSYAMSKTDKSELAEDLVQETFLSALNSVKNFKGQSSEKTWLFAILKFKIADYYRKASTKYEFANSKLSKDEGDFMDNYFNQDGEWTESASPKSWNEDASIALENKELGIALNDCIEKLAENQKQLVLLKMVEETETEIVCKELNITPTNYWVIIHRAKLQLRACIEKTWFKA